MPIVIMPSIVVQWDRSQLTIPALQVCSSLSPAALLSIQLLTNALGKQ